MKNIVLKYLLFGFMLVMIFLPHVYLPMLQKEIPELQAKVLQGVYEKSKKPNFWPKRWLQGTFQKAYENYVRDRNEISHFMLRLKTQTDYLLFRTIRHENIILGSDSQYYSKADCESYIGRDFKGKSFFQNKLEKLQYIIDYYKEKNIPFFVLTPPGKPSVLPNALPAFYRGFQKDSTNRKIFSQLLLESGIPFLDFEFLIPLQDTSAFEIFGKASLHWSHYGFATAADTLCSFVLRNTGISLPKLHWRDSIIMDDHFTWRDKELVSGANFLVEPKIGNMPYPNIRFVSDSLTRKPRVLSVGDSFYLTWFTHGVHGGLFAPDSKFLYYHNEIYPEIYKNGVRQYAHDLDILEEIEAAEMVLVTAYEPNLNKFAYNFIEKVYGLLKEKEETNPEKELK